MTITPAPLGQEGACPTCRGAGLVTIKREPTPKLPHLDALLRDRLTLPCPTCGGGA